MAERPVTNPGAVSLASAAAVPARGAASSLAEQASTTGRVIRSLPTLLVNQIAAGEVVERPASVVKELLENALDASASRIEIELEQGGIELIRITDDGCGIDAGQLPMALAPHATSKLRDVSELERIATMGFRGEALASITSVSRLSIRSRTAAAVGAAIIEAEGDSVKPVAPVAGPVGTQVTVRNLFFNTPARRKFLRTPATEQSRCADAIRDAAMAHCAVAFRLVCDGRTVIDVPPGQSPRERIVAILGKELGDQLLDVSGEVEGYVPWKSVVAGPSAAAGADPATAEPMTVWGLAGLPSIARATAQAQHVFVNGRPIRDRTIMHAIKEAYRGLIEPGRHPTAVLLLEMDPAAVDVNVHPTKSEVRFRESSRIHSLVLRSIQDALRRADLTPAVRQPGGGGGGGGGGIGAGGGFGALGILPAASSGGGSGGGGASGSQNSGGIGAAAFAKYFRREVPASAGGRLDFDAIRAAVEHSARGETATGPAAADAGFGMGTGGPAAHAAVPWAHAPAAAVPPEPSLPMPVPVRPIVQVHNSYLVTQDEQGMLIVDQHALHERVMFEKLLARVTRERGDAAAGAEGGACLESQRLLTPTVIPASPAQVDSLDALRGLLDRIGVAAEPIGPTSIAVHAFPTFLFDRGVEVGPFMTELLDKAQDSGFVPGREETLHEVLDMMACKAAIKAGNKLSETELAELLSMRERIERSSNCPHGRPTSIRVTIKELERRFGRV